jgi:hypothetical protein
MNKKPSSNIEKNCAEEKLFIRAFKSACALKQEIRRRIRRRAQGQWNFCGLSSKGAFIFLCFRKPQRWKPRHPEPSADPVAEQCG